MQSLLGGNVPVTFTIVTDDTDDAESDQDHSSPLQT
jgi:acetylornithine/succinyldiaminopimelate/putrescine aminotransferase